MPHGYVWRTGSDNATRISFSTTVKLNDVAVGAGTHELFTIPGATEWTVIIHQDKSQWGAYSHDAVNDVARVTAKASDIRSSSATLGIAWERARVPIRIEIDVRATAVAEKSLAGAEPAPPALREGTGGSTTLCSRSSGGNER